MMFYNPHSYEHLKQQLEERRVENEQLRRADAIDQRHQSVRRTLVSRVGGLLLRLGTWLEQPARATEQLGG
jgi:hypothetical protein